MAHDTDKCKDCPTKKAMEKFFKTKTYKIDDDTTCTDYACGCYECHEYCDIPGFRSNERWTECRNCIHNQAQKLMSELPQYKGTYEDLLKVEHH